MGIERGAVSSTYVPTGREGGFLFDAGVPVDHVDVGVDEAGGGVPGHKTTNSFPPTGVTINIIR